MEKKQSLFRFIYKTFLRGFLGILPLCLTVYAIIWFFHFFGGFTDNLVSYVIPFVKGVPGIGLLVGGTIIFLLGLLFSYKKFIDFFTLLQFPFKNMPLIKTVYTAVEDLMFYFSNSDDGKSKGKAVLVKIPGTDFQAIGLLTREDLPETDLHELDKDMVAVFIPMSYGIGGYTIFVPRSAITMTKLNVDYAMKSALTAWMKKEIK